MYSVFTYGKDISTGKRKFLSFVEFEFSLTILAYEILDMHLISSIKKATVRTDPIIIEKNDAIIANLVFVLSGESL
jgi:hypothetical protein